MTADGTQIRSETHPIISTKVETIGFSRKVQINPIIADPMVDWSGLPAPAEAAESPLTDGD
jgi:hypothetical protein